MLQRNAARRAVSDLPAGSWLGAALFVASVGLAAAHHESLRLLFEGAPPAIQWLRYDVVRPFHRAITHTFLHPAFFVVFPLILLLEWRMPARPEQRLFSAALAHDALYVPLIAVLRTVFVFSVFDFVEVLYARHLDFLTVTWVRELPEGVRVVWGLVLYDLLLWWQHRLQHAVPWLWQFHALHHAQRDLNVFTDDRGHVVGDLVRNGVAFVPMAMLCPDRPAFALLSLATTWYSRFCHANVRTNLGPLRHFLVTPQIHRIHHSIEPEHRDRNFGAHLNVWDRLFGTFHDPDPDEYPATGIPDPDFPLEQHAGGLRFLLSPLVQQLHPLRVLARRPMRSRARHPSEA